MVGLKYINRLVQITLIILIALSFYLSYLIWLFPANQEATNVQEVSPNVADIRSNQELFLPTQLIFQNKQAIFTSHSESLIREFQDKLAKVSLTNPLIKSSTSKKVSELNTSEETLIFHYLSAMNLQTYLQVYHLQLVNKDLQKIKDVTFDTVQIDLVKNRFYFMTANKQKIYQYSVTGLDHKSIQTLVNKEQNKMQKYPLKQPMINGEVLSNQPIKLQLYSYISAEQPYTVFRDAFFNDTKNIKINDDAPDVLSISNNVGDMLTINLDTQLIDYRENNVSVKNKNLYQISAKYIANLGTSMGQLRYFNHTDQAFTYRLFVEGYPIFRENNQDAIHITFSSTNKNNQKNIKITGSLTTIQVPIPSEKTKELPGAAVVYQQLFDAGLASDEYPMITIGYQWTDLQDTGVVDLIPTWFVYHDNQWYQYQDLMKQLQTNNEPTKTN